MPVNNQTPRADGYELGGLMYPLHAASMRFSRQLWDQTCLLVHVCLMCVSVYYYCMLSRSTRYLEGKASRVSFVSLSRCVSLFMDALSLVIFSWTQG